MQTVNPLIAIITPCVFKYFLLRKLGHYFLPNSETVAHACILSSCVARAGCNSQKFYPVPKFKISSYLYHIFPYTGTIN